MPFHHWAGRVGNRLVGVDDGAGFPLVDRQRGGLCDGLGSEV